MLRRARNTADEQEKVCYVRAPGRPRDPILQDPKPWNHLKGDSCLGTRELTIGRKPKGLAQGR